MIKNWEKSLKLVLKSEGGYVDDPRDSGGATMLGVTQKVWQGYVGHTVTKDEMKKLTPEMVAPLYKTQYWDAVFGDYLLNGIDYLVFDFAVNAGPHMSLRLLQRALGIKDDGIFGSATMGQVVKANPKDLILKFSAEKEKYYKSLGNFDVYGKGWLNRVADVQRDALSFF